MDSIAFLLEHGRCRNMVVGRSEPFKGARFSYPLSHVQCDFIPMSYVEHLAIAAYTEKWFVLSPLDAKLMIRFFLSLLEARQAAAPPGSLPSLTREVVLCSIGIHRTELAEFRSRLLAI